MKATYYYADGTGALVPVPCEADEAGSLTKSGASEPFCTGATATPLPVAGSYVLASTAEDIAAAQAAEEIAAAQAAEEIAAAQAAEEAAAESKAKKPKS